MDLFIRTEMDGHCTLSAGVALEADAVVEIFADNLQYPEIFFGKILFLDFLLGLVSFLYLADLFLQLPYRQSLLDYEIAQHVLQFPVFHSKQDLRMADAQKSDLEIMLYFRRQIEQPEIVGHGCPLLPDSCCELFVGKAAFIYESLIA